VASYKHVNNYNFEAQSSAESVLLQFIINFFALTSLYCMPICMKEDDH